MIRPVLFQSSGTFSLILICAMLGACATTQRSSTGSGDQTAAPISDANPQTAAKPGDLPGSPSSSTPGAYSPSNSAKSAAAGASSENTGARQGATETSATDDAAQLRRQLADQDAQINRLRDDQQAAVDGEEVAATQLREEQADAAGAASATRSRPQDGAAVFPANSNIALSGGAEARESSAAGALERSVYFDYNQASVPEKYNAILLANAAYLKAHAKVDAEVHGHCDERGSREYNLALGARRGQAVKRALELAGVDGDRISVVSYGAEKPVAFGKDEESYSQNRRVDIVY